MDSTKEILDNMTFAFRETSLNFGRVPLVMGIVNVTPDSFSDGGRYLEPDAAVEHALHLVRSGADLLDIGGESTRPGSDPVSTDEELSRVMPVIEPLVHETTVPVSIDTHKAAVAEAALVAGCHMVNDVSACADEEMTEVLCKHGAPVAIMHMKGDPKTMQEDPYYENVIEEVRAFLKERAEALAEAGVPKERIIIDPGIGFGKRFKDNLDLINGIGEIRSLGYPVLLGASRKRFLGELLTAAASDRLFGGLAVAARCYMERVEIIRVHDVKATGDLLKVLDALAFPADHAAN
jgi:dihydropteroate synthase